MTFFALDSRGVNGENACDAKKMKKKLIAAALCVGGLVTACKDDAPEQTPKDTPQQVEAVEEKAGDQPDQAVVRAHLLPLLAAYPATKLGEVKTDATPSEQGVVNLVARVQVRVEEDMYTRESAPDIFDEERKAANDAINRAMLPEAHYLLLAGAETSVIRDQDRQAKPLPEELQKMADELKSLAESPVYHLKAPANTTVELPATMQARKQGSSWVIYDMHFDTAPLQYLLDALPEGALPQGASIVNEGFEDQQRAKIRDKVRAFREAAQPYIDSREEAARKRALEEQTRREESEKAAAEQAAADTARKEAWELACTSFLRDGSSFSGEWKRGNDFGKFTLRIARGQAVGEALQFIGTLADPDIPQAEVQVVGRCEMPPAPQEPVSMVVHLHHGRYNPDTATAEVFDAADGMLELQLAADGVLSGVMTCESWQNTPEKNFDLHMNFSPKKQTKKTPPRSRKD